MPALGGRIRIIGGKWRGRVLKVTSHPDLRPTPDRVRETLFNWLAPTIVGARCLDLFAGTGVLGLEALSRGASEAWFIDKNPHIGSLREIATELNALDHCHIIRDDALHWLRQQTASRAFDVIFLDPPFSSSLLSQSLTLLAQGPLVNEHTLLYIECAQPLTQQDLPEHWQLLKEKKAGDVFYHLIQGATL